MKIKIILQFILASILVLGAFAAAPVVPARADTKVVSNTNDSGPGSLRQAIADAVDGDTIDLTGISGVITLTSFELSVNKDLTIIGPGTSNLTISGNNARRVFFVSGGKTVSISGVTIANGLASTDGGGIYLSGTLTLDNVLLSNNNAGASGGGIATDSSSSLTITNSRIINNNAVSNGGGIHFTGTSISLDNVVIDNNHVTSGSNGGGGVYIGNSTTSAFFMDTAITNNSSTAAGGGLASYSSLTIFGSLVANNSTSGSGGQGGGLFLMGTSKTYFLVNVTVSGNTASNTGNNAVGGGIYSTGQTLNMWSVTVTENTSQDLGGGIFGSSANMINTIIAGNTSTNTTSEDCAGTLSSNRGHNLVQVTTSCTLSGTTTGNITGQDPLLDPLADNGGPTMTHSLQVSSPAIDAGYSGDECPGMDQRGSPRPQDGDGDNTYACDIGAYEVAVFPTVASITLASPNPTSKTSVDFTVTFSKYVTGVDASDFALTSTTLGASITEVINVDGSSYTVKVNTGTGNGTIRLDVADDNSIKDTLTNPLGGLSVGDGDFTGGETYTVQKSITFKSTSAQDGWILESTETSGVGGKLNKGATTLRLGDDAANRQYRAILSFDTSSLPEGADITSVTLTFKYAGKSGTLPFNTHGKLLADISMGGFKNNPALQLGDFKAGASRKNVLAFTKNKVNNWYSQSLDPLDFPLINTAGVTQFRLRFKLDDNNDFGADFLKIYSGDADEANRPQLIVEYYVP
jgi:hypothetical protein